MRETSWAMLIFAAIGAALALRYLRDRARGQDVTGVAGRPALLAGVGLFGSALWVAEDASFAGFAFWWCLVTGAAALGFTLLTGLVHLWGWMR